MKRQIAVLIALCLVGVSVSAQSRRYGTGRGITVYTDPDFRGESATFRNDTPDLRGYGLNDKVSSIELPNGEAWEICQDVNYGNRCQVVSGSLSNLRDMGWNDRISSLRRVAAVAGNRRPGGVFSSRGSQSLRFFDRADFRGSSTLVTSDESDLSFVGRPRSVEVRGGTWQLCDRSGRCATVTQDVSDLTQVGLRDRLRSANLVNDRGFGNRGNQRNQGNSGGWWRP
jgi:beta/gamma crystallin